MLLATLGFCLLAHQAPKFDKQADELFRWLDGLGCAQYLAKPLVEVKDSRSSPWISGLGFLVEESPANFKILRLDLTGVTYPRAGKDPGNGFIHLPYSFDLLTSAFLDRSGSYPEIRHQELNSLLAGSGEDATFAWILHKRGRDDIAAKIIANQEESLGGGKHGFVQVEKDWFARAAYDSLVPEIWNPKISRPEILLAYRRLVSRFHDSSNIAAYRTDADLLAKMVEEDRSHAANPPTAHPTTDQKIAELIWQLRNEDTARWAEDKASPRQQLTVYGLAAVPQLIGALHDERFARLCADQGFVMRPQPVRPLRVRDVAHQVLEAIANRSFGISGRPDFTQVESEARGWFESIQKNGEEATLVAGTLKGDSNSADSAEGLAEKFPSKAAPIIERGYFRTEESTYRSNMLNAVDALPTSDKIALLRVIIRREKDQQPRAYAIRILATEKPDEAMQDMIVEWHRLDSYGSNPFGADAVAGFLIDSGRPEGVSTVAKDLATKSVNQREQVVSCLISGLNNQRSGHFPVQQVRRPTAQESQLYATCVEDLLGAELADRDRYSGGIGIGQMSFTTPEISELACYAMSQCFPKAYKFVKSNSPSETERTRLTFLKTYRSRRGLPPVALPPSHWPAMLEESVAKPLIDRLVTSDDPSTGKAVTAMGLRILPALLARLAPSKNSKTRSRPPVRVGSGGGTSPRLAIL